MKCNLNCLTNRKDKTMDKETLQARLEGLQKDNKRLLDRYGDGVRPSWVSTDIAINSQRIKDTLEEIRQLDSEWSGGYGKGPI